MACSASGKTCGQALALNIAPYHPLSDQSGVALNVHIYPSRFTNESRILKIVRSLREHNVFQRILVIAAWKTGLQKRETLSDGIDVMRIAPAWGGSASGKLGRLFKALGWHWAVLWALRKQPVSCFNCHSLPVLPIAVLVKIWKRCTLVYEPHELETETAGLRGWKQLFWRFVERTLISRADVVCVVNQSIADWYVARYRLKKIWVVRNVPYRSDLAPARSGLLRNAIGVPFGERLFLYQGLLAYGRGIELLIDAFSKLPSQQHLVFMGYGELEGRVKEAAARYPNIHFMNAVLPEQVKDYTVDADVGVALIEDVCRSYYLCLPNKLFEYAACGIPTIVSDFPEMGAFVSRFDCGWRLSTDAKAVQQFVMSLDDVSLAAKRMNTREAGQIYCWQEEEKRLLSMYEELPSPPRVMERSKFLSSVGAVMGGAFLAQLIPILGTLVLARIFEPASYGLFSAWLGGVYLLAVVLSCRFELSLAVEADGQPRRSAVVLTLFTIGLMSLLAIFLLCSALYFDLELLTSLPLVALMLLVPTGAILASTQTLQNWAAADGRYRHLTAMRVTQASLIVLLQIFVGMLWPDASGLAFGYSIGTLFGLLASIRMMPIHGGWPGRLKSELLHFWKGHRRFPLFSLPADTLSVATAQLPVLIVAARFGAEAAGLLAMALRVLGAPMVLLSASVLDVFKRYAGQAWLKRGECRPEYVFAFKVLVVIAALAALAIAFWAEHIFNYMFGAAWQGAGTMALWLLSRFAIGFVASPLSYMTYVAGKQHLDLVWQCALTAMTLATLTWITDLSSALILYGIGYGVLYCIYLALSYRLSLGRMGASLPRS